MKKKKNMHMGGFWVSWLQKITNSLWIFLRDFFWQKKYRNTTRIKSRVYIWSSTYIQKIKILKNQFLKKMLWNSFWTYLNQNYNIVMWYFFLFGPWPSQWQIIMSIMIKINMTTMMMIMIMVLSIKSYKQLK